MNLIVAADKNWAIGNRGRLLVTIPEDQKLFRQETLGKVIVMGRKTMESLPGGQALPGRTNVVLTRNRDYKKKGVTAVHGMDEALSFLKQFPDDDINIIGGGEIYAALLPYCSRCAITRVYEERESDAFFPNLDAMPEWRVFRSEAILLEGDTAYQFMEYIRREP